MPFAQPTLLSVGRATAGYASFIVALFILSMLLPGPARAAGSAPPAASRRQDRWSGLVLFGSSVIGAIAAEFAVGGLAALARHYWSLLVAANLLALAASVALFVATSTGKRRQIGDFFFGNARNPALCGLDLKLFSYRPSLIGLALLNLSVAALQWRTTGRITLAMALYQIFTLLYVANYFHFERGMRFTWDIIEERFGWSLVWGDYVLVPAFYCLPGLYVLLRPDALPIAAVPPIAAAYTFGFWLFRGANQQKHRFKEMPTAPIWGRPANTVGGRLLVSGFWGIGRKLNYTGEFLMYLNWTLLAGFHSWIPYCVPVWLLGLLAHRAARDDRRCRAKYGELWDEYCRHARFRMFPFLY